MRSIVSRLFVIALVGSIALILSAHRVAAQRRPSIALTRLYTGPDGQAHAENTEMKLTPSVRSAGVEQSELFKVSGARFFRWPPGHVEDWHNAPQRQYALTLSGRGEVGLPGGQKLPIDPGRIFLVEDVTGKGHITRSVGAEDWVFMLVPFALP